VRPSSPGQSLHHRPDLPSAGAPAALSRPALDSTDHVELPRFLPYDWIKGTLEFAAAFVLVLIAAPIIGVAAVLIRLTSPGPVFYSQTRLGRQGRRYTLYKLRTMRHNCEKDSGPCWSVAGDPRVTPLGRILRRLHMDELPQLINVLRGDMALVGPRPERPEFLPQLHTALPLYRTRLLVRPGLSGLAQVQLPPDTDLESVRRKLAYDLYYVRYRSPWLDLRILLATGLHLICVPYAVLGRLLLLPSAAAIEQQYLGLTSGDLAADECFSEIHESNPLRVVEVVPCV
jgi:lipopolysaccharide/colanic/teichoic acid biosynthesis glycosyltransferase